MPLTCAILKWWQHYWIIFCFGNCLLNSKMFSGIPRHSSLDICTPEYWWGDVGKFLHVKTLISLVLLHGSLTLYEQVNILHWDTISEERKLQRPSSWSVFNALVFISSRLTFPQFQRVKCPLKRLCWRKRCYCSNQRRNILILSI